MSSSRLQKAIEFIRQNRDNPFCYMVSYPDPHGPNTVRAPYDTMFNHLKFRKPETATKSDEGLPRWAKKAERTITGPHMAKYFGMVKCIDDNVGKLINYLRDNQLLDNTIIVFTSDHGDLRGEHHRHNKGNPLEASAKIPFIVYYPAKIPAGSVVNNAFNTVDFAASILSFMGQKSR